MNLRRIGVMVAVLTMTVLTAALGTSPAVAAQDVAISSDGRTWHGSLTQPLFDPAVRWVPGDRGTARFYVRNRGPSGSYLSLQFTLDDADRLLAKRDLALAVRVGEGRWQPITDGGTSRLIDVQPLSRAATTVVDVRAYFDWEASNRSQHKELPIQVMVTLAQSSRDQPPHGEPAFGALPETGATIPPWLVWVAAITIGAGAAVVRAGTRELPHA